MGLVLSQAAITNFAMTPEPLDDVKDMLHLRTHTALAPIPFTVALAQRSVPMAFALHAPTDLELLIQLLLLVVSISAIAVDLFLCTVNQGFHQLRIVHARRGDHRGVGQATLAVCSDVQLHPKMPFIALFGAAHLGVARAR